MVAGLLKVCVYSILKNGSTLLAGATYGYASTGSDSSERLQIITDTNSSDVFTYAYKPNTDLVSSITSSGPGIAVAISNTYADATGYKTSTATTAASQTTYQASYTYTTSGQRATETIARIIGYDSSGNPITQNQTLQYSYSPQGQLTAVTDITNASAPVTLETFDVDALGNRISTGDASNNLNEYTSYTTSSSTALAIAYNSRGDLTSDGLFNYSYDAMDRMVEAEALGHSVNILYTYDAQGRLISRTRQTGWDSSTNTYANSVATKFAYDGNNLTAVTDASGNVLQSYLWGSGISGSIGGLLSVTDYTDPSGPQTYKAVSDASGNVVQLIDSTGKVAASYTYSAYGIRTSTTGPAAGLCNIGFQSMYTDADTGMVFFPARIYSPTLGIWVQRDPSGESSDVNLDRYCDGDPINKHDSTGLEAEDAPEKDEDNNEPGATRQITMAQDIFNRVADQLKEFAEDTAQNIKDKITGETPEERSDEYFDKLEAEERVEEDQAKKEEVQKEEELRTAIKIVQNIIDKQAADNAAAKKVIDDAAQDRADDIARDLLPTTLNPRTAEESSNKSPLSEKDLSIEEEEAAIAKMKGKTPSSYKEGESGYKDSLGFPVRHPNVSQEHLKKQVEIANDLIKQNGLNSDNGLILYNKPLKPANDPFCEIGNQAM